MVDVKNEEEKDKRDSRDMIAIEHVINDITNNYACEYLNTNVKAVSNSKLNIWIKLSSIGKSTIVGERDSKELSAEVIEPVRKD